MYKNQNGNVTYKLAPMPFASGGEGAIYDIVSHPGLIAKIYHPGKATGWIKDKLNAMVRSPLPAGAAKQIAWPMELIYKNGSFCGFVMKKFNFRLIGSVYNSHTLNLKERIALSKSLSYATYLVHKSNHVIGDFNENNIGYDRGSVYVIDCDSFQIKDRATATLYRCCVGVDEYLAPEIFAATAGGKNLRTLKHTPFSRESDNFSLALHIFKILFASNPFACALTLPGAQVRVPSAVDNARNGYSPFFALRANLTIPVYAPSPTMLPPKIYKMFKNAFIDGATNPSLRPNAAEWYAALDSWLGAKFNTCTKNHIYPAYCSKCPFCESDGRFKSLQLAINSKKKPHISGHNPPVTGSTQPRPNPPRPAPAPTPAPNPAPNPAPTPAPKPKHSKKYIMTILLASLVTERIFWNNTVIRDTIINQTQSADAVLYIFMMLAGIAGPMLYAYTSKSERWHNYFWAITLSPVCTIAVMILFTSFPPGVSFILAMLIAWWLVKVLK